MNSTDIFSAESVAFTLMDCLTLLDRETLPAKTLHCGFSDANPFVHSYNPTANAFDEKNFDFDFL